MTFGSGEAASQPEAKRLAWLDALRVWALGILILFHASMIFNHWPWYVKSKSPSPSLTYVMLFFSQFRLPLLFLVSGAASAIFLERHTPRELLLKRNRLLLPIILAGFALLSPLQILAENYFGLRQIPFRLALYPEGFISWHHLWFIVYLWGFTTLISALPAARSVNGLTTSVICAVTFFTDAWVSPAARDTRDVWGTWHGTLKYFAYFYLGSMFMRASALNKLKKNAFWMLLIAAASTATLYGQFWLKGMAFETFGARLLRSLSGLIWAFAIFGLAARFEISCGAKLNRFVLPIYVLHQPVMLWLAALALK